MTGIDFHALDMNFEKKVNEVVSGGAFGADAGGQNWARRNGIPVRVFEAEWKRYGMRAGPMRNALMAEYADAVVLFPGGRGTESMYQEAKKNGIKIYDWRNEDAK